MFYVSHQHPVAPAKLLCYIAAIWDFQCAKLPQQTTYRLTHLACM